MNEWVEKYEQAILFVILLAFVIPGILAVYLVMWKIVMDACP
jgi:hypothetical protein